MSFGWVLLLSLATGFIALSYEIVWYRVYSVVSWTSPAVFGLLLAFYLLGIAVGSYRSRVYCQKDRTGSRFDLHVLAAFLLLANCASLLLVPVLGRAVVRVGWWPTLGLVALATALLGAVLPLICHFAIAPDDEAGAKLSYVYLANIIGSALGSLLTGFVLFDRWRLSSVCLFLALVGFGLVAAVLQASQLAERQRRLTLGGLGAVALGLVVANPALFDQLYERLLYKHQFRPEIRFAEVVENRSGVITVTTDGRVFGGGAYDGVFNTRLDDDRNGIVRAYAVGALHPAPRQALMIGLASGSWGQVVAHLPGVEKLTIVEINPGYLPLIERQPEVRSLLHNPRIEIAIDDGRRWLVRHPDRRFDAIVMNSTWHWRAHATHLLSTEFLEIARAHLRPGGLVFFNTTGSAESIKTAAMLFPYALRVLNCAAASDAPLVFDVARWRKLLAEFHIDGRPLLNLERESDRRLLDRLAQMFDPAAQLLQPQAAAHFGLESRDSILSRTASARVITDDNMASEFTQLVFLPPLP